MSSGTGKKNLKDENLIKKMSGIGIDSYLKNMETMLRA